jgi:hypothetical protein
VKKTSGPGAEKIRRTDHEAHGAGHYGNSGREFEKDNEMSERDSGLRRASGISRRELIRRGAVVGGTLLWAAPAIQSLAPPAFAQYQVCGCCYCWNGDKQNPGPPNPGEPRADQCGDNGCSGFQATPEDCRAWCSSTGQFGAPGGPFENSEHCCGTSCICNTADDPGLNGCTCT